MASPLNDDSGNGRTLTMTGTVPQVPAPSGDHRRFGKGYGPFSTSNHLKRTSMPTMNGDMAITLEFYYDGSSSTFEELIAFEDTGAIASGANQWALGFTTSAQIQFGVQDSPGTPQNFTGGTVSAGHHTLTLRRISNSVVVKLDGASTITATQTTTVPNVGPFNLAIGINDVGGSANAPFTSGSIHNVRIWGATNTPSQATLDAIVSLTDNTYLGKPEGNEIAFYRFEQTESQNTDNNVDFSPIVDINVFMTPKSQTNWNTLQVYADAVNNFGKASTGAQNAEITWHVVLGAGTWTVELIHRKANDQGTYSIQFDAVEQGTINAYNGATTNSVRSSITGIVVSASGRKELKLKMATKDGSSASYYGDINHVQLKRTA